MHALSLEPRNCILSNQYLGTVLKCENFHLALQHDKSVHNRVFCPENNVDLISGYITAEYDGFWWLGCVVKMKQESRLVKVNFLHPHGPAPSFFFPEREDIFEIDVADFLKSAAPLTTQGEHLPFKKRLTCSQHKT